MKKFCALFIILIACLHQPLKVSAQCIDCNTMVCDGISSDDGTSANGVQTARKCGCGTEISGACAYVEIDLSLNPYFDPNDPNCGLILETQESGSFNIYILKNGCDVADCSSPDFSIKDGEIIDRLPESSNFSMMVCKIGGNAARRDFNFSISCSTIENCVNSVDDDKNGFIDCDDPACNLSCDYTNTSSSLDGGLESNSRLSDKVSMRNYERALNSNTRINYDIDQILGVFGESEAHGIREELNLLSLVPWDAIKEGASIETTPFDLLQITNATDIFAFDTYKNNKRIASVLATETDKKVYEHSKYICDRLAGASIESIWNYDFGTKYKFIVSKLRDQAGSIEYNCNFSIIKNSKDEWTIESHWELEKYSEGRQIYNFQLWANNTHNLQEMLIRYISNLQTHVQISHINMTEAPKMFIKSISYHNKEIFARIYNPELKKQANISGLERYVERSSGRPFQRKIDLKGILNEEFRIPSNGIFDMSFILSTNEDEVRDLVYIADGAWGIDNPKAAAILHKSDFLVDTRSQINESDYLIERGVELKGRIKNELTIFRAVTPHQRGVDLTEFSTFNLIASGLGSLEITLINKDIDQWEDQPKTTILLEEEAKEFIINKEVFEASKPVDWNKISMIVFKVRGNFESYQNFHLKLNNLRFSVGTTSNSEIFGDEELKIYPNPIDENTVLSFSLVKPLHYEFQVWSMKGDKVLSISGIGTKGINQVQIECSDLPPGVYLSRLLNEKGEVKVAKLVVL